MVRSTAQQLPSLQRALTPGRRADRRARRGPAAAPQPAVAPLLLLLRCALEPDRARRGGRGRAAALAAGRGRPARRAAAAAGAAGARAGRPATGGRPASCWSRRCATRPSWPSSSGAGPRRRRRSPGCSPPPGRPPAGPGATAEDVLWAVWRASGLAERWAGAITRAPAAGEGDRPRGGPRPPTATSTPCVVLFDAAARFTDRLPGARTEVFLDHVLGQELPADTLAAERRPGRGGAAAHRARRQGPGVGRGRGRRRAGGRLARPAAARQPARLGAAGRRARRPGGRRRGRGSVVGQTSALLDEERRLFYVAATRARRRLLVTAVDLGSGRRRRRRGAAEPVPARAGPTDPRRDRPAADPADPPTPGRRPGPRPSRPRTRGAEPRGAADAEPAAPGRCR